MLLINVATIYSNALLLLELAFYLQCSTVLVKRGKRSYLIIASLGLAVLRTAMGIRAIAFE